MIGFPVENIRVVMTDGTSHAVDSSELAFRLASIYAFRQVFFLPSFRIFMLFVNYFSCENEKKRTIIHKKQEIMDKL